MTGRVTLEDVGKEAGVSKATVSAVINNKPIVRDETKGKVLDAIEKLGYHVDGIEMRLKGRRRSSIGLIIKEGDNPFYMGVASGARDLATERGYALIVVSSQGDHAEEMELVALLKEQGCSGLIMSPTAAEESDLSYLFVLRRGGYPLVMLEQVRGLQADLVTVDNVVACKRATQHLIDQGHGRIIHFAGPDYSMPSKQRAEGFRLAFSESHLKYDNSLVIPAGAHIRNGYEVALKYFSERTRDEWPTAIVCYNDQLAIGVYRAMLEMKISVPEDVSIIGHDNIELTEYFAVPITSVDTSPRQVGCKAAELLIRRIEGESPDEAQRVYLETTIAERESVRNLGSDIEKSRPASTDVGTSDKRFRKAL